MDTRIEVRRGTRRLTTLVLAAGALALLGGCGIGAVGAAAGVSGGGSGATAETIQVSRSESMPRLSAQILPEPAEDPMGVAGLSPDLIAEPTDALEVAFTQNIDTSLSGATFRVRLKRPMGPFIDVSIEDVVAITPRRVRITLTRTSLLNGLYEVRASGVESSSGNSNIGTTRSFFVVRDGTWSEPELLTLGNAFAGGITVTPDLNKFATIEQNSGENPPEYWTESIVGARFDAPWSAPKLLYTRVTTGAEAGVELRTGPLHTTTEIATFRWNEGNPNLTDAGEFDHILRAPVGVRPPTGAPGQLGYDFGPRMDVVSAADPAGRVDQAGPPELGQAHFTFNGPFMVNGNEAATVFWALSDAQDVGLQGDRFVDQKVYANDVSAVTPWPDWGPATLLSAPGVDHNSWPIVTQFSNGEVRALWWSATTTDGIFASTVDRYWMATWTPGTGWSAAQDITPTGEQGMLPAITAVQPLEVDPNGMPMNEIVVFAREVVSASTSRPTGRRYDLTTGTWQPPTGPAGSFDVNQTPTASLYNGTQSGGRLNYALLRGRIGMMTPRASALGTDEYLVRWISVNSMGMAQVFVAEFSAIAGQWGIPVDLSAVASINNQDPFRSSVSVSVDLNGWATLKWREMDPMQGGRFQIYARRVNLITGTLADLGDPNITREQLSPSEFTATAPGSSNVHSSGAFATTWQYGIDDPGGGGIELLGSAVARFQ